MSAQKIKELQEQLKQAYIEAQKTDGEVPVDLAEELQDLSKALTFEESNPSTGADPAPQENAMKTEDIEALIQKALSPVVEENANLKAQIAQMQGVPASTKNHVTHQASQGAVTKPTMGGSDVRDRISKALETEVGKAKESFRSTDLSPEDAMFAILMKSKSVSLVGGHDPMRAGYDVPPAVQALVQQGQ